MCTCICCFLSVANVLVLLLYLDGESCHRFDEVVVVDTAVRALVLLGELREAEVDARRFEQRMFALVALDARLTAGEGRKEVVVVHCTDLMSIPAPSRRTQVAGDLIDAHQTFETDRGEKERIVRFAFHLVGTDVCLQGREIEGAIDERKLVVNVELSPTQNTENLASSMEGETREHKGAGVISSAIPVVLHLYVVRVDQMTRDKPFEDLVASAVGKRLHVRSPVFTRNGIAVVSSTSHPHRPYNAVGNLVWQRHFFSYRPFPSSFELVSTLGRHGQVFLQRTLTTATRAQLVDQIVALFSPEILPPLLFGPITGSTHAPQTAQHLLLEVDKAFVVHPGTVGTLVVAAHHLHRVYLRTCGVHGVAGEAVFGRATQREGIRRRFTRRIALGIAQLPRCTRHVCPGRREMGLQGAIRPRRRGSPPRLLLDHWHPFPTLSYHASTVQSITPCNPTS